MKYFYLLTFIISLVFGSSAGAYDRDSKNKVDAIQAGSLIITGYVDSTCPNDNGRTLEVFVNGNVDLNAWSVEVQNDGNGFNNLIDLSSLGTITNDFIYITNDANALNTEFGITDNVIVNASIESDGNEAFQIKDASSNVVDRFGVENVNGFVTVWNHENTFFYRKNGASANGGSFDAINWDFGNINELSGEGSCNSGDAFSNLVPFGTYLTTTTAEVQIIHNSADPNLEFVDVYVDDVKILDDIEFRTATDFTSINADTPIDIEVAPQNSNSSTDSFYTFTTTLDQDQKYVLVANGVQDPANFDETINDPIAFELSVLSGAREEAQAISGNTDILIHHGSTDAQALDFVETTIPAGTIADNLSYTEFSNYVQIATNDYRLEVKSQDGVSLINTYDAPLANLGLQNNAITILASGFLDPSSNQSGDAFGLWLAKPDGGDLIELPFISSCTAEQAPYLESFESAEWQTGFGLSNVNDQIDNCWERFPENDGNNYTWSVNDNETGSTGTGPNEGFDNGKYIYTEASAGDQGDEAVFRSPVVDLSNLNIPALQLQYFMFGDDVNQLIVEAKSVDENSWTQLFGVNGQQQQSASDDWIEEEIDLSSISGSIIEVRFIATRGGGFQSDIAIDALNFKELTLCDKPENLSSNNIGDNSVDLSWDDVPQATDGYNWFIYNSGDDPASSTPVTNGSTNAGVTNVTVTGLSASTTYDAYVEADCASDGLSDLSNVETFTTNACPVSDQCDYTFTLTSTDFFGGWNNITFDVIQDGIPIATLGPNFDSGSSLDVNVTLCEGSNIELFWDNGGFSPENAGIAITDPFGSEIYNKPPGNGSPGTTLFTFTAYCTQPTCPKPENLSVAIQDATSVDLNWDDVPEATNGYEWQIFEQGDIPGTDTPILTGNTASGVTNATATGLSENTTYDAYVIADCDTDGVSVVSNKVTFTTPCATLTTPWIQDFDGSSWVSGSGFGNDNDQIDQCWNRDPENTGNDYFWGTRTGSTSSSDTGPNSDISGNGNYIYAEASQTSNGDQATITSPPIDLTALAQPFLYYNIYMYGNAVNSLTVEVKEINQTNWTEVNTFNGQIQTNDDQDWQLELYNLNAFSGQVLQVRFVAVSGGGFQGDIAVDNVSIDEAPSCISPANLSVSNIGDTSVDLSWDLEPTASAGYNYEIYLEGDVPNNNTPIVSGTVDGSTNSVTTSGLSSATSYEAYIQSDCGAADGLSELSGPVQFTTNFCDPSESCTYEFELIDSFGDGWNGAQIQVIQDGVVIETLGSEFTNGDEAFVDVDLCNDSSVELFWDDGGQFSSEVGLSVTDPFGDQLYSFSPGSESPNSTLTTFTADCDGPSGCFPPDNFASTNLQPTSVDLTWDQNDDAFGGYDWFIFNAGDDPLNTTPIANGAAPANDTLINVDNLTESTSYDAYIRSDCGIVGVSSLAGPVTFTTPCSAFSAPYAENFDGNVWQEGTGFQNSNDQIDACWTRNPINDNNNYFWGVGEDNQPSFDTGPADDFTGGKYIYSVSAAGSDGSTANIVSPKIDLSNLTTPSVQFKFFMYGEDMNQLEVQAKEINDNSWTSLLTITGEQQTSQNDAWEDEFLDLTAFSGQTIEVRFIATKGVSFRSEIAIDDFKVDELPSCITPDNLSVDNTTDVSADFNWDSISNATNGYQVDVYLENDDPAVDNPVESQTVANGVTSATVDGLANSTNYKAYLFADCGGNDGLSDLSEPVFFITDGCQPSDQCDYTFELEDEFGDGWNGNTVDIIQDGITIQTLGENFNSGSNQTVTVPICDNSNIEIFWNFGGSFPGEVGLAVTNPFGQEIYNKPFNTGNPDSSLTTFTSSCTPPPCDVPANFTTSNIDQNSVQLNWDESTNASEGYDWAIYLAGDDPQNDSPVTSGGNAFGVTQVSISGLTPDTDYEAYLEADCGFDVSGLSNPLSFSTLDVCDVPSNLSVDNIQQNTADLNWDEVPDASNGYEWFVFAASDDPQNDTPVANASVSFGTTSVSVSGLTADTDYEAYVQADCNFDLSDLSNPVSFTTIPVCDVPSNLSVDNIQQNTADLNWDEVPDASNGYEWFVFAAGDDPQNDTPVANASVSFGTNSVSVSGLSAGTDYEAYIQADCNFDLSDLSNPVIFTTLTNNCDVPTNLSVDNIQQNTADLNWDEVPDASNGYEWFVFAAGDDPQNDTPIANATTAFGTNSVSVSGLTADTDYEAYIQADCNFDLSDLSNPVSFTTLGVNSPVNDALCNSVSLTIGDTSNGSEYTNINASVQNNEPVPTCFTDGISSTVWFDFVAPSSGNIEVTTDFNNAGLTDTQVAVYETSGTCDDLVSLVEVGCAVNGGTIDNDQAVLSLDNLNPGQTYYVQVDQGAGSASGTFGIQVNETLSDTSFDKVTFDHYPNPVTSRITIESSIKFDKVTIFDMNGKSIRTKQVNAKQAMIDMNALQAGVYFLHVEAEGNSKVLRVIKQ